MKRHTLHKLIFSILLFAISFLALFTSHKSSAFADWYSSTIYPLFVSSIGRFFGIFQFSVSEIGLYIFVILLFLSLIWMLISSIYKMYAQKKNHTQHVVLNSRATDGTRTRDLHLGKVAYYQLYYYRTSSMFYYFVFIRTIFSITYIYGIVNCFF